MNVALAGSLMFREDAFLVCNEEVFIVDTSEAPLTGMNKSVPSSIIENWIVVIAASSKDKLHSRNARHSFTILDKDCLTRQSLEAASSVSFCTLCW
jgi:hypothetical protein